MHIVVLLYFGILDRNKIAGMNTGVSIATLIPENSGFV